VAGGSDRGPQVAVRCGRRGLVEGILGGRKSLLVTGL
jgi:hypothetical protein